MKNYTYCEQIKSKPKCPFEIIIITPFWKYQCALQALPTT